MFFHQRGCDDMACSLVDWNIRKNIPTSADFYMLLIGTCIQSDEASVSHVLYFPNFTLFTSAWIKISCLAIKLLRGVF